MIKKIIIVPCFLLLFNIDTNNNFAFLINSYCNEKYCTKNIKSVITQRYENFIALYTDDASPDKTSKIALSNIRSFGKNSQFFFKKNKKRKYKAKNFWLAAHNLIPQFPTINDNDIIVSLDGDDWYENNYVLTYLNNIYSDNNIWLTYGGYKVYPDNGNDASIVLSANIIKKREFRLTYGYSAQQRSFYAWLYRKIKLEDFFYKGKFIKMTNDTAKMIPMLEMSGSKFKKIETPLYIYNRTNSINDDKVDNIYQHEIDHYIRSKNKYDLIKKPSPTIIQKTLDIVVIDDTKSKKINIKSDIVKNTFYLNSQKQLKKDIENCLKNINKSYILITEQLRVIDNKKIETALLLLSKTHSFSFNLTIKKNNFPKIKESLALGVAAWQNHAHPNLIIDDMFNMQIYNKNELLEIIHEINFTNIDELKKELKKHKKFTNPYKINLFFSKSLYENSNKSKIVDSRG